MGLSDRVHGLRMGSTGYRIGPGAHAVAPQGYPMGTGRLIQVWPPSPGLPVAGSWQRLQSAPAFVASRELLPALLQARSPDHVNVTSMPPATCCPANSRTVAARQADRSRASNQGLHDCVLDVQQVVLGGVVMAARG
jgi:hypothetical protein